LAVRPDLQIKDIRGNVETRLRKLDDPELGYDAILLAQAGLSRLNRTDLEHAHPLPQSVVLPAPGQGALAVQGRAVDPETNRYLHPLEHQPTRAEVTAERSFLAGLGGGCAIPVGALGVASGKQVGLEGIVASPDGRQVVRVAGSAPTSDTERLGRQLAAEALARGAAKLLP
jgi:hydroxymethylbilane synthase